ncbi:peptidoglycan D,D-transpeptidase FtsI family protein [Streptomyces fuscigenes]|uniref:peptidoglycan D,D-transpeptidase FtsI family protein n=1 Tax=Streptomyces fuscigenes TaxID=1528880 RepID=UPI001F47390C|nr:penicillin-binding transpeptidase domain-containing protein [Streptomyces fuscigenes]MCF3961240.1 penicillin-binding protein 2 [Streptomyces fuscigenes]
MNKPLRRIAIFCGLLVLALLVRENWLGYVKADALNTNDHNARPAIERYSHAPGNIIVDGKPVTGAVKTDDTYYKYKQTWKDGPMWAPVTGYGSQVFGSTALESIDDGVLSGTDPRLFFDRTVSMFTGKNQKGGDVVTTLNADAQKAAYDGLKGKKGAAVAIDPSTGKILALASTPSYDPSTIAGRSDGDAWKKLTSDKDEPMLNRALRQTYPPGSTFKLVTAAAGLENGVVSDPDAKTDSPLPYIMPGTNTPLKNEGNLPCKNATLRLALTVSCNSVFGHLGVQVGKDKMLDEAKKFGFNSEQFIPTRADASEFPTDINQSQTALSSIGQFDTRATPLQMAMVASAIANDGKLMKPYLVDELRAPNLDVIDKTQPEQMSQPLSAGNAQKLQSMMESVVNDPQGTGHSAKISGATVGGKTGTAQHGVANSALPYAWFVSYAKVGNSTPVAVAVVVEDGAATSDDISGGGIAGPIAHDMMKAVIDSAK